MTQPLVVVHGADREFAAARRNAPNDSWIGVVADEADAAEALLAAVWGRGVVVHAVAAQTVVERLVEDLRRFGPVDYRTSGTPTDPALTHEEHALLELLAAGTSLGKAAELLHVSRRTADRRLASARKKLGAGSTAETLVRFSRASGS